MRKLVYSLSVSLDGYINDANGSLNWVRVDEEYHRFANAQQAETGLSIYGTNMWRTMAAWDTMGDTPNLPGFIYEFAELWKPAAKLVVSHTLQPTDLVAGARLLRDGIVEEVARLKAEPGKPIAVAGATLASTLLDAGLVDEIQPFYVPAITGGGTPFLKTPHRVDFELIETKIFKSGTVYHRYAKR